LPKSKKPRQTGQRKAKFKNPNTNQPYFATPGKKDFYDQVYHSKKGKLHKEIRRTKSQTYNVC